jgi:hypothetical protein
MTLPLVHSRCASRQKPLGHRFAHPSSRPSPGVLRSFVRRAISLCHNSPSWILLVSLLAQESRPNVVLHTCTIFGSFPLDNKACASPSTPNPPDLWFSCALTRARASPYATYVASIRCVVLRAPRSSRSIPPLFFRCPLSVSHTASS